MATDHYLPLFVGDFLASTATWTGPERGLYVQLLMLQWGAKALPSDHSRLARAVGYTDAEFAALWPTVREKFEPIGTCLVNVRLEEIRERNAEIQAARSAAGKRGAHGKWYGKHDGKHDGKPNGKLHSKKMPSEPNRNRIEEQESAARTPGLSLTAWADFMAYRKAIGKPIKPASMEAAAKRLAAFGSDQAAVVEQSKAGGWQGLFALKDKPKQQPRQTHDEWPELQHRASKIGFREPRQGESPQQYQTLLARAEEESRRNRKADGPTRIYGVVS